MVNYFIHASQKQDEEKFSRQMSSMNEEDIEKASNLIRLNSDDEPDSNSMMNSQLKFDNRIQGQQSPERNETQHKKAQDQSPKSDEFRSPLQLGTPSIAQMTGGMNKRNNFISSQNRFSQNNEEIMKLNSGKKNNRPSGREIQPKIELKNHSYISEQDEEYHVDSYAVIPSLKKNDNKLLNGDSSRKPSRKIADMSRSQSAMNEDDKSLSAVNLLGQEVKSMRSGMGPEEDEYSAHGGVRVKPRIEAIDWNAALSRDEEENSEAGKTFTETDGDQSSKHHQRQAKNSNIPSSEDEEDPSEVDKESAGNFPLIDPKHAFAQRNQKKQAFLAHKRTNY
jgi:hypothetical protein